MTTLWLQNVYFNFFSVAAFIPAVFMLMLAVLFGIIRTKSLTLRYLVICYAGMAVFFSAYIVSSSVFHPYTAFHRWVTVATSLFFTPFFGLLVINLPERNKKASLWYILLMYPLSFVLYGYFLYASFHSNYIFQFAGHYWDFDADKASGVLAKWIVAQLFSIVVLGVWKLITVKTPQRWSIFLIAFVTGGGLLIPGIANLLSREGLIDRGTYQVIQDLVAITTFFIITILFINTTKDRTPFMLKVLSISVAALLFVFQVVVFYTYRSLEAAYDSEYANKTQRYIETSDFPDESQYISVLDLKDSTLHFSKLNNEVADNIAFKEQKQELYNSWVLQQIGTCESANDVQLLIQKTWQSFDGYKNLITNYLKNNDFDKNQLLQYIASQQRLVLFTYNKINQLPETDFETSVNKLLQNSRVPDFSPALQHRLQQLKQTSVTEQKQQLLQLLAPMKPSGTRFYRKNITDSQHYIAFIQVSNTDHKIYEVGYPYLMYRATFHPISKIYTITLLLAGIVVLAGFPFFFWWTLIVPVKNILDGLRKVRKGNLDVEIPVNVEDEFGVMSHNFNSMTDAIRQATENLEQKVRERTQEVVKQKEEIEQKNTILEQQKEEMTAQAEQLSLANSELEKLSIVASETDNAIIITDAQGNYEWVNQSFSKIFGITQQDLQHGKKMNLIGPRTPEDVKQFIKHCVEQQQSVYYEFKTHDTKNNDLWIQATITPVLDNKGNVDKLVVVDADITKIKKAEAEIKSQKHQVEAINELIKGSIRYALRIQQATLPQQSSMDKYFSSFVLYKPKDIVSGDFYWFADFMTDVQRPRVYIAVVDCTGHGVPGAFMSMIGSRLLSEIVHEKPNLLPAQMLNRLDVRIKNTLNQHETDNNDGMDVSLCMLEWENDNVHITYSGAKRPLLFYSKQSGKLEQLDGDRKSIGGLRSRQDDYLFTNHEATLHKGDLMYLFSDGIIDQNSPERKRFGSRQLEAVLLQNVQYSLQEQKQNILNALLAHQKEDAQRDDITMIGIRL